jgi:hypothetical protein
MEGAEERTRIFVAEEISDLADSERRFLEIVMRQLPAALVQKVSKTGAFVRDAALQGPAAHAQLLATSVITLPQHNRGIDSGCFQPGMESIRDFERLHAGLNILQKVAQVYLPLRMSKTA